MIIHDTRNGRILHRTHIQTSSISTYCNHFKYSISIPSLAIKSYFFLTAKL